MYSHRLHPGLDPPPPEATAHHSGSSLGLVVCGRNLSQHWDWQLKKAQLISLAYLEEGPRPWKPRDGHMTGPGCGSHCWEHPSLGRQCPLVKEIGLEQVETRAMFSSTWKGDQHRS